ncbi:hypothetical protein [Escherichia coli]|uniref:hypothetical protein n=1 Tax=Escherichia coli TaxID=562 RepID=UPI003A598DAF
MSGFATTDLSVMFCDVRQGGEAYGKTPKGRGFLMLFGCSFLTPIIYYLTCFSVSPVRSPQTSDRA